MMRLALLLPARVTGGCPPPRAASRQLARRRLGGVTPRAAATGPLSAAAVQHASRPPDQSPALLLLLAAHGLAYAVSAPIEQPLLLVSLSLFPLAALARNEAPPQQDLLPAAVHGPSQRDLRLAALLLLAVVHAEALSWLAFPSSALGAAARSGAALAAAAWLAPLLLRSGLWAEHVSALVERRACSLLEARRSAAARLLDGSSARLSPAAARLAAALDCDCEMGQTRLSGPLRAVEAAVLSAALWSLQQAGSASAPLALLLGLDAVRAATAWLAAAAGRRVEPSPPRSRLALGVLAVDAAAAAALAAALAAGAPPAALRALLLLRHARLCGECAFALATAATPLPPPCDESAPPPAAPPPPAALPPLSLGVDAFTTLALAGVRGYMRGREAAVAVGRLFAEADVQGVGKLSPAAIARWVALEPEEPQQGAEWRAAVRRVLSSLPVAAPPPAPLPVPRRGLRLLSLEGGGIKGLALIWQLQAIEAAVGRPIHECFDLIGGTSTGGLVALALHARMPLARLEELYYGVARDVFAQARAWRALALGASADAQPLYNLLRAAFGEKRMRGGGGGGPRAFVVATKEEKGEGGGLRLDLRLLRTYDSRAPSRGRDAKESWALWEAAAATSAAPTVFPAFRRSDGSCWVDGAMSGNTNPSLLVALEGMEQAAGEAIDLLLSLGCGEAAPAGEGQRRSDGVLFWLNQTVSLSFDTRVQEERTLRLLGQASPATRYMRLTPRLSADVALAEHRPAELARLRAETAAHVAEQAATYDKLAALLRGEPADGSAEWGGNGDGGRAEEDAVEELWRAAAAAAQREPAH